MNDQLNNQEPAAVEAPKPPPVLLYVGAGAYVPGVPARNLTQEDIDACGVPARNLLRYQPPVYELADGVVLPPEEVEAPPDGDAEGDGQETQED